MQEQQEGNELRLLYQYEHENRQLSLHIQTLTARLHDIISKPQTTPITSPPPDQHRQTALNQQLKSLYQELQKLHAEAQAYKRKIDQQQESKCIQLENAIRSEQIEMMAMKRDALLQKKHQRKNSGGDQSHQALLVQYKEQLIQLRKEIKELVVQKNQNQRKIRRIHVEKCSMPVKEYDQSITYTQIDVWRIQKQIQKIQKEIIVNKLPKIQPNDRKMQKIKFINQIEIQINKTPIIRNSINKSFTLVPKQLAPKQLVPKQLVPKQLAPKQLVRNANRKSLHMSEIQDDKTFNDKNIKHPKKMQWSGSSMGGIDWNDSHLKSQIKGVNIWIDKRVMGLQFLFQTDQSQQHLFLTKAMNPIQYRLVGSDALSNVVLTIKDNLIIGLQFQSKAGRVDCFGIQKGKKFDFGGTKNNKIVNCYGRYKIHQNCSQIICLGFEFS